MSETRTLPLAAFTIKEAAPGTVYGEIARPSLSAASGANQALLLKATMPTDIPPNAIVSAAEVQVTPRETLTGSTTLTLKRNTSVLRSLVKWNNAPTFSATASAALTRTGSAAGVVWPLVSSTGSVVADVQGFISGTLTNHGWRLTTSATTARQFFGATSGNFHPVLVITYSLPSEPPTDLMPTGGAVSVPKPVLTFNTQPGTIAINVQISPTSDPVTAWDSGTVAATAGVLDLSPTTYPGLTNGSTTNWRARSQRADVGWSDWSDWFSFSRTDQPALTLISPTTTPGDGSPPFSWTFTGQTAWRAQILSASGRVLADSGAQSGTDTTWQPTTGLTVDGSTGTARIQTRDGVVRVATPGAPTWVTVDRTITFSPSGSLTAFSSITATQPDASPKVTITATRATVPDEVVVYRTSGSRPREQVARVAGVDYFSGTTFTWTDTTAPPNLPAVYKVVPVTIGTGVGSAGPTASITPRCTGLWLIDPETLTAAVLYGTDDGDWTVEEIAVDHQPAAGEVRRRRLFRPPPRGTASGDIVDADYQTADVTMAVLDTFAENEPSHVYRYVAGHENIAVRVSNVFHRPTPVSSSRDRHAIGGFAWRGTAEG